MSTGLRPRSKVLLDLVTTYFRSYPGEAVIREVPHLGAAAVEVVLSGALASRFESVTVPQAGEPGRRLLRLLLDPQFASVAQGFETLAPRTQLMRLIQNDPNGRVGFARSVALVNVDGTFDDLASFLVTIQHASPSATARYHLRSYLVVAFLFRQAASEKNEDVIRVAVETENGRILDGGEAARLIGLTLADHSRVPPEYGADRVDWPRDAAVDRSIRAAVEVARTRAGVVAGIRVAAESELLALQKEQVERLHQAETRSASPARRAELEGLLQQNLEALERRHRVQTELSLMSVQEILVPAVNYQLSVGAAALHQVFTYDPLLGGIRKSYCDRCGRQNASQEWCYCGRGVHLECAACDTVRECYHPNCRETSCVDHGVQCASCRSGLCPTHEVACRYCTSADRYCEHCLRPSFEGSPICGRCANECKTCHRLFTPLGVENCGVCGGNICQDDRRVCPACDNLFCGEHGVALQGREGTYCQNCRATCGPCGPDRGYLRADVGHCSECGMSICPDHALACASCGGLLCHSHALDTPDGPGCSQCYATCQTCHARPVHRGGLRSCRLCPPGDAGLHCTEEDHAVVCVSCGGSACEPHRVALKEGGHACRDRACAGQCRTCRGVFPRARIGKCEECHKSFCPEHLTPCVLCGGSFCPDHGRALGDGRWACSRCASGCQRCGGWFERSGLSSCPTCEQVVCHSDSVASGFGSERYCRTHAAEFVACPGCARRGPSGGLVACPSCGVHNCPHCMPDGREARCAHCRAFAPLSGQVGVWESCLPPACPGDLSRLQWGDIQAALTTHSSAFAFESSESLEYLLLRASYRGGLLSFVTRHFWNVRGFIAVLHKPSRTVTIRAIS